MYDQEKIKKMKNHELAMEAYFYAYNHKLFGGASQKKAVKCYEFLHMEGVMWQQKSV